MIYYYCNFVQDFLHYSVRMLCVLLSQGKKGRDVATGGVELNDSFFKGLTDFLQLYSQRGNILEKKQLDLERCLLDIETKLKANIDNLQKQKVDNADANSEIK